MEQIDALVQKLPETFSTKVQHNELKLFLKFNPYSEQILIGHFLKPLIVFYRKYKLIS